MTDESAASNELDTLQLSCRVLAAFLRHNTLPAGEVPSALRKIHQALVQLTGAPAPTERPKPAVPIKKSVTRNYIVCLEDGRKLKILKSHLRAKYDMTPEEYRAKWKLPTSYPMVAPAYAEQRSAFAKETGLGRNPQVQKRKRKK